ncbi:MAG: S-methyl-5'-thioadenosine phosphorylase [Planctomycetota bacterium]
MKLALIGGTGLGEALGGETGTAHHPDTPFGKPSAPIIETHWADVPVLILQRHGDGHLIRPTAVNSRANLFALKQLGATHVLASGAVGSLREEFAPKHLLVPDQIIDKTSARATTFYENAAVHVEFADPFSGPLRQLLLDSADAVETPTHPAGCYVCMEGPAFSTKAESHMHRLWGGDVIGMTAMPEARLAREAELPYALVALVTDYDCWRTHEAHPDGKEGLLREIIGNLQAAAASGVTVLKRAVELAAGRKDQLMADPIRDTLAMAIWSDKSKIPPDEVTRLSPLWGHHFD